jgi:hypothetical protein
MAYEYASFISWPHMQEELGVMFIKSLKKALDDSLEPHVQERIYLDEERLAPGYNFEPALATAMCKSACWVLVYSPRYLKQDFCRAEYQAMQLLEVERRRTLAGKLPREHGLIIPVLFRGEDEQIPDEIRTARHYADFRKFSLVDSDISRNKRYVRKIEQIAKYIASLCALPAATQACDTFEMPPPPPAPPSEPLEFPGRQGAS